MFGRPLTVDVGGSGCEMTRRRRRPGTAESIMSAASSFGSARHGNAGHGSAGASAKRSQRLQRMASQMALQADLEKKWQLEHQHRPITPATLERLSEQVSRAMEDEFPELQRSSEMDLEPSGVPKGVVEPLEVESPTRDPAPSPLRNAAAPATSATGTTHPMGRSRHDAGPFRPNGSSALRDQPLGGPLSRHHMPAMSPTRSLAPLEQRSVRSNSSLGSRRSSRRSGSRGSVRSRGSIHSAVFSGSSNSRSRSSRSPMTAEETLALDAGMRRKMEQAGVTPNAVKRQLQFNRRSGRPISRDGRCMDEDLGNAMRMLGVPVTRRELRSFTERFRGTRDQELESHMIMDHLWSEPILRAASRIAVQPNLWVGNIPDYAARADTLRAVFRKFGNVATLSLKSEPFDKSWCTVTFADDTPDAAAKALQQGAEVMDAEGNQVSLVLKPQTQAPEAAQQRSSGSDSPSAQDMPKKVLGGNDDFDRFQNLLQVTDLENALRKALVDARELNTSASPFMLVVLEKFEKADKQRVGRVPAAHLDTVFSSFGMGLHENAYYLLASKYNHHGDSKYVDYHRLMGALCPPELKMEDKTVTSDTQAFVAGKTEAVVEAAVTGSFFDVAEKIKEEVKGNRSYLKSCFERLDRNSTGELSVPDVQKALQLLRVGLSQNAIRWHFGPYIIPNTDPVRLDYRRCMEEMFAPDEEFYDNMVPLHEVKHVVNTLRHTV
eukprot:COSAG02_NODE_9318_length_2257_cov_1.323448_1_plen_718_part_01